uniref:Ankyrin repeat domain-containing protein 33B-like n=1 Tax=Scleropages formosus TaxID=113540 RepID=A0A8C9RPZ9_SCLFO
MRFLGECVCHLSTTGPFYPADFSTHPASEDESLRDSDGDDDDDDNNDDDDEDDVYQEFDEYEDFSELPETRTIASDDSFYPHDTSVSSLRSPSPESPEPISFFQACCNNNSIIVKIMIRQRVTEEEVKEMDKNNRTGLIVACYHGFVDVVMALAQCPYVDVNWQDKEGNTALIMAAQAGEDTVDMTNRQSCGISYTSHNVPLSKTNTHSQHTH